MINFIKQFFPPYEVRITLEIARGLFDEFDPACRSIIMPIVEKEIRNSDKTTYSIRIDHMKPDHLALLVMTNVIGRHLGSGVYHTYRGRLNPIGTDLLNLWNLVQSRMLKAGYITVVEKKEDDDWLLSQIASVG